MPHIILDYDPPLTDAPQLQGDTSDLVYFLSWAFSARYGASHELAELAQRLRSEFKLDLVPLLTFADREVEEPGDAEMLERAWQDAAPLADCCDVVARTLAGDDQRLGEILDEYPRLRENIEALAAAARWAAGHDTRIRVTYELGD